MTYAIETFDLSKRFPQRSRFTDFLFPQRVHWLTALSGVNIRVEPGEIFGLLGPNGAGKTTLIKLLCTLLIPDQGKAYVNGYNVVTQSDKVRRSIGYCLDAERSFYFRLSGRQNLAFFATLNNLNQRQAKVRVEEVLEIVQLSEVADKPFMHYSAGMRQRLSLARALLNDALVFFMDEPTKILDPVAVVHLWELLKGRIVAKGDRTIMLTTQSPEEAEQFCDRIAILNQGEIKACGSPNDLRVAFSSSSLREVFVRVVGGK